MYFGKKQCVRPQDDYREEGTKAYTEYGFLTYYGKAVYFGAGMCGRFKEA